MELGFDPEFALRGIFIEEKNDNFIMPVKFYSCKNTECTFFPLAYSVFPCWLSMGALRSLMSSRVCATY